ncbi:hypothetical protein HQ40_06585 [Porphyromonas gulae]|uniref:Uncharacterized protein n=1 Tax=Porphyromonas gulae TaxID=111105 RepID=A0A0A2EYI0_9PORP|nr:hypothetical protein HQ40_06585 [Porphyromonas gulae]KGN83911.1 hypothetical protein HR08_09845 [Porphyromonas gulae]
MHRWIVPFGIEIHVVWPAVVYARPTYITRAMSVKWKKSVPKRPVLTHPFFRFATVVNQYYIFFRKIGLWADI